MTMLEHASRQWSSRPADQRFKSLAALHAKAVEDVDQGVVSLVDDMDLKVTGADGDVRLISHTGKTAALTNWSFGQLCGEADAPAAFIAKLPALLAADVINDRLRANPSDGKSKLLFRQNSDLTLRALNSTKYTRIWNHDVTQRLVQLEKNGEWQPAPEAFDGSRGLYLGDRDMFVFMVDNDRRIFESLPGGGLSRGFFCWNSEVGAATFGIMSFLYEYVCGNHRVWGAQDVSELRIRHIGDADERGFAQFTAMLTKYANSSTKEDEAKIILARNYTFGATKDEVLDRLFGLKVANLTQDVIEQGYAKAVEHEDWYGSPNSAWGIAGGITEIARDMPNADQRVKVDTAARKVMEIAF